ncbi:hypothetical protein MTR67_022657 [Solanum verrucosum]|uniref:CCHC-type domain-containing protein n=1 Tax=Solanum verrucosum TaxID=315347 RepID=A0AAF0TQP9_SOLVR|nr:hypothetical protein MTR67_022657 [Solanum verrucosum]
MVDDMMSRMILFIIGLTRLSSKESKAAMLIGYMGIARLMIHVQQVDEDQLRDKEEFKNKRAKTSGNESRQQKARSTRSQGRKAQRGTKTFAFAKCGRNHSGMCRDGSTSCFKCGQNGHFMRECPKRRQSNGNEGNRARPSSVAPPDRAASR